MNKKLIDAGERIAATAAEAGIAYTITLLASIPKWWVMPLTTALAAAKTWLAQHTGRHDSASLAPGV